MNVVEAFFITLGLDTREYEKKQKGVEASLKKFGETSDKQTKVIAESAKKAAGAFSALKIEILGAIAAYGLGDGIKGFIESNVTGNAALGRMSRNLRMSASDLKAWGYAAESVGGKAEDATNALQSVAKGIADAKLHGSSQLILASNRYGIGISGNDTPEQALLKINRALYAKAQRYGAQQAMAIAGDLGIDNYSVQQLLMRKPDKNLQLLAHYRTKTGHVDTKDAIAFQGTLTDIRADIGNLRDDLFGKMAPAMEVFAKKFEAFLDKITPKLEALVERFANWLAGIDWQKVIDGIERFIDKVLALVRALGGVKGILIEIAAIKVLGWVANIGLWVLKLRSLTAALTAARAAAAAGGVASAAGGAAEAAAAGGGAGIAAKAIPLATRLSMWALPVWALFHSENTGGKRRADGTYEDEFDWNSAAGRAAIAKQKAAEQATAMKYLMGNGLSRAQAAGIVGNLMQESSMNPRAVSPDGGAFGLMQLRGDRIRMFQQAIGVPIQQATEMQQLQYLVWELHHSERKAYDALRKTTTAGDAAKAFGLLDERFGSDGSLAKRIAYANSAMAFVGAPRTGAAKHQTTNTSTVTINGPINVQTKATDANGVARGMKKALNDNPLISGFATALR